MAKYAINEIGLESLCQLERDLRQFVDDMEESRDTLLSVVHRNEDDLGVYLVDLMNLLDNVGLIQSQGQESLEELADKVHILADKVEALLARGLKKK